MNAVPTNPTLNHTKDFMIAQIKQRVQSDINANNTKTKGPKLFGYPTITAKNVKKNFP